MPKELEPGLIPIKRVSQPMRETEDEPTQGMITRIKRVLPPRYQVAIASEAMFTSINSLRFPQLSTNDPAALVESINVALRLVGEPDLSPERPLKMISGVCLFGSAGLLGITESGKQVSLADDKEGALFDEPIVDFEESYFIQPYEVEAILKMTEVFNFLMEADQSPLDKELYFHVPSTEYKLYMLDLVERGLMDEELALELFDSIDRRAEDLLSLIMRRLPEELSVSVGSPLEGLEVLFEDNVPTAEEVMDAVRQLPVIGELVAEADVGPDELLYLCQLSYQAGYIQVAQQAAQENAVCLAVDPTEEERIYKEVNKRQKDGKINPGIDLALLQVPPKVITTNGRQGKPALFKHRTNPERVIRELVTVMALARNGGE